MSVLIAKSVSAQTDPTTPRPAVPEFNAKVVDTNLEVTIKNQPLLPYENGSYPNLYYMFRFRDNNTMIGQWYYDPIYYVLPYTYGGYYKASDSDFTTVSLSLEGKQFPSGLIGIQVTALFGNQYQTSIENGAVYAFEGHYSGWSNTQTITVPSNYISPLTAPAMAIITPMPVTYQNSSIPLFFGANVLTGSPEITSLSYSLDDNQNVTITALGKTGIQHFDSQTGYTYHINSTLTLDNLSNGNHTLWVYSHDAVGKEMSGSVKFTVDANSGTPTEQLFNYWFLISALIIVALALLVVVLLLFRRHRKSPKSNQ